MDFLNRLFGYVISFCNKIVGNQYILALFVFAILMELLLLPFGIKQQKNSIKQAKMHPKEKAIRKKYAGRDDAPTKQKMQQEIQELYQKEGYNPMGGCLPLLIQFPIIILLYNVVMNPLKYICGLSTDTIGQLVPIVNSIKGTSFDAAQVTARNVNMVSPIREILQSNPSAFSGVSGFDLGVNDLPNLTIFGDKIDLGATPGLAFNWLLLIPVLTFLVYFFSMKLTRKLTYQPMADDQATGCSNKMMDITMPLLSVFITFSVPAAIGVYWIFKSIIGTVKQWILKMAMPIPVFTEEDYKAAEKAIGARQDRAPKTKSGKVVRSLHHIDDEDFEDTREAALKRREALEAQEAAEAEAKKNAKGSGLLQGGALKSDEDKPNPSKKKQRSRMSPRKPRPKKRKLTKKMENKS